MSLMRQIKRLKRYRLRLKSKNKPELFIDRPAIPKCPNALSPGFVAASFKRGPHKAFDLLFA